MINEYIWLGCFYLGFLLIIYFTSYRLLMKRSIKRRLTTNASYIDEIQKKKFQPYYNSLVTLANNSLLKLLSEKRRNSLLSMIRLSGTKYKLEEVFFLKLLIAAIFLIVSLIITYVIQNNLFKLLIMLYFSVIGYIFPDIIFKNMHKKKQAAIKKSLPYFIDYLTLCTEAGLGFDLAINKIIERMKGPLSEELIYVMAEIKYGKSKKEAFNGMIDRINLPEVKRLFNSILSTEQIGGSIKNVIRFQGDKIRQDRKQKIQEKAYKMPVKLLFPLIFFIFPSFFIVILGPAILQILNIF